MSQVITIDCQYLHPEFAAAYLVVEGNHALFIDNNTAHAVGKLLAALKEAGLSPENVEYLIVTHAHLDHAGGTSALLARCPGAQVLGHPKAIRTLVDPSRLLASAKKVYGEAAFAQLYGDIQPLDAGRVRALGDGESLRFHGRLFNFFYTQGHATHHLCIHDSGGAGVFTGDAFGLHYPILQRGDPFIFPSTSPIDFDPEPARLSIQQIVETGARQAFLTHFGSVGDLPVVAGHLLHHLDAHQAILEQAEKSPLSGPELASFCETKLRHHFAHFFDKRGWRYSAADWELLRLDLELNGAGIAFTAEKRRRGPVPRKEDHV